MRKRYIRNWTVEKFAKRFPAILNRKEKQSLGRNNFPEIVVMDLQKLCSYLVQLGLAVTLGHDTTYRVQGLFQADRFDLAFHTVRGYTGGLIQKSAYLALIPAVH